MEAGRTRWSDERIDDLALGVRDDLRELRADLREMRAELHEGFRAVYSEVGLNRRWMAGMWITMLLGFAGLIVEVALRSS